MKIDNYKMLKIEYKTANHFSEFSSKLGKQETESLELMLSFFNTHGLSPLDELGPNFTTLEKRISRKINAVMAILRDIEKTQTKPTLAMLQLLFQQSPVKQEVLIEKKRASDTRKDPLKLELQKKNQVLQNKLLQSRAITSHILTRVTLSRSSFGKVQLRLMMTQNELEEIKLKLKNL